MYYSVRGAERKTPGMQVKGELPSLCWILGVEFLTCFWGKERGQIYIFLVVLSKRDESGKILIFCDYFLYLAKTYHFNLVCTYLWNRTFVFGSELRSQCWMKPDTTWKWGRYQLFTYQITSCYLLGITARLHFQASLAGWFIHGVIMASGMWVEITLAQLQVWLIKHAPM